MVENLLKSWGLPGNPVEKKIDLWQG